MKRRFLVQVNQNGGESASHTTVVCDELTQLHERSIMADSVIVEFDEDIEEIIEMFRSPED